MAIAAFACFVPARAAACVDPLTSLVAIANQTNGRVAVPAFKSTADLEKGTCTNDAGLTDLRTVWTDPEFDPSLRPFYYARVLEMPTPRPSEGITGVKMNE